MLICLRLTAAATILKLPENTSYELASLLSPCLLSCVLLTVATTDTYNDTVVR